MRLRPLFITVLVLTFAALVVGFVAGIVVTLAGSNGSGLTRGCGMPPMVVPTGAASVRKRRWGVGDGLDQFRLERSEAIGR